MRLFLHILLEVRSRFAGDHGFVHHKDLRGRVVSGEGSLEMRREKANVPKGISRIFITFVKIERSIKIDKDA